MEAPAWGMGFVKLHPAETKSGSDRKRVNFNAFPAKLLAASPINGARLFIFALTDLCNTLECEPWKYYGFLARKSGLGGALQTPMQVLASDILAVAQWIIHPGNKLLHQGIGLFDDYDDDDDAAEQERRHRMIASDTIYGRLRDSVPRDGCSGRVDISLRPSLTILIWKHGRLLQRLLKP